MSLITKLYCILESFSYENTQPAYEMLPGESEHEASGRRVEEYLEPRAAAAARMTMDMQSNGRDPATDRR